MDEMLDWQGHDNLARFDSLQYPNLSDPAGDELSDLVKNNGGRSMASNAISTIAGGYSGNVNGMKIA